MSVFILHWGAIHFVPKFNISANIFGTGVLDKLRTGFLNTDAVLLAFDPSSWRAW